MNTDTIKLNRGVGNGGAYWCQNIRPANDDGVFAGISMTNKAVRTTSSVTSDLGAIVNFTQLGIYPSSNIFGRDTNGDIYLMNSTGGNATKAMDYSLTIGLSEGLMIDTNNDLVYTGSQYIGIMYSTTLDGQLLSTATACDLVDATNFPTAGFAIIAESNKYEVIQWTGKSSNQLTGVTHGKYNTTAATHATGSTVYYFKDQWLDLGASLTSSTRRCITWEDRNFFVNGNKISGYHTDGATAVVDYLTLEEDKEVVDIGLLPTSATSYVLVGANSGENGYIYTWDGKDTATISERELKNNNISRIWDNFIATDNGIYRYDGTNLELITEPIEDSNSIMGGRFDINDMKVVKNYLLFTGGLGTKNRNRKGFWYVNLDSKDKYFVLPSSYGWDNINFYGIFPTAGFILVGNSFNEGSIDVVSEYPASRGSLYQFIYEPTNAKTLQLKGLRLNVTVDPKEDYNSTNINFDVIVRGYDFTRQFIKSSQLKSGEAPSGSSQLIISDSLGVPSIGDRIEIISRNITGVVDSVCAVRNITGVTAGSSKYIIDVDEAFPVAIDAATQNSSANIIFNPLKKLGKVSVNSTKLNLLGYDIPLREQPMFKKMLFEIEVRCGNNHIAPQLNSMEISYEILD